MRCVCAGPHVFASEMSKGDSEKGEMSNVRFMCVLAVIKSHRKVYGQELRTGSVNQKPYGK